MSKTPFKRSGCNGDTCKSSLAAQRRARYARAKSRQPSVTKFDQYDFFSDFDEDDLLDLASRPISPWPSLLNRSIQAVQRAMSYLGPPFNARGFYNALDQAQALLSQAAREVVKVMSGSRRVRVMDQLGNAMIRIRAARSQASGKSLVPGGRSLISPKTSLRGAIAHIRSAQDAVGLRLL